MKFYLLRHAKAEEREAFKIHSHKDDFYRPLTHKGILKFQKTVERIKKKHKIAHILYSPFKRCEQTAEILSHELKLKLTPLKILGHGENVQKLLRFLKSKLKKGSVFIGHEPELSLLVDAMGIPNQASFKKGELRVFQRGRKKKITTFRLLQ